ncbi:MAG: hypothetical protein ACF8XB_19815 [Planctomycetota bacterium JB042]
MDATRTVRTTRRTGRGRVGGSGRALAALTAMVALGGAASAQLQGVAKVHPYHENLLGNGGFESWTLGTANPAIPPELWYPLGDPTGLFSQTSLLFKRIAADGAEGSSGEFAMEVTSLMPGGFVAQTLPNHREYCGEWVTFAVDLSTPFPLGQPTIEVFDGVGSTQVSGQVVSGTYRRLVVSHRVAAAATTLQFRIVPDPAVRVDGAQAVLGKAGQAIFAPPRNKEPALDLVPLGVVFDWWRFDPAVPLPDGFAICDGQPVTDPLSPFLGRATPDLTDRFVKGVTNEAAIGTTGGSATVDLSHDHPMPHTHAGTTGLAKFVSGSGSAWNSTGVGNGTYHEHDFTTGPPSTPKTSSSLGPTSIEPPFVGLLKLVRVR